MLHNVVCATGKAGDHACVQDTALQGMAVKLLLLAKALWKAKFRFHAHNLQQGWGCTTCSDS